MKAPASDAPRILQRADHPISRKNVHANALKVLYRLRQGGHLGYLVGGGVRDLLIGRVPKDYDIATDARPQQMKGLFRNSRIIGRRFRIAHVYFREGIVEVSTFRRDPDPEDQAGGPGDLLITNDNIFGTPREDAFRRDFTVNALFYEIGNFTVVDYVGGLEDLRDGVIRCIGDPDVRFQEDPVRMLRACEMAARLDFEIDPLACDSISQHCERIEQGAPARVSEELLQILGCGSCAPAFDWMRKLGLLDRLLPPVARGQEATDEVERSRSELLSAVDDRVNRDGRLSPAVLTGSVLLPAYLRAQAAAALAARKTLPRYKIRELACEHVKLFATRFSLPRRRTEEIVQSFQVLYDLQRPNPTHRERVRYAGRPGFGDALELLTLLTSNSGVSGDGGAAVDQIQGWRALQKRVSNPDSRSVDSQKTKETQKRRRPRRRRRRR